MILHFFIQKQPKTIAFSYFFAKIPLKNYFLPILLICSMTRRVSTARFAVALSTTRVPSLSFATFALYAYFAFPKHKQLFPQFLYDMHK